jgi:deazaflavin-dependent oxidoreductase (nitroreductase family)
MIRICGKRFGHFAILSHTGRKSGNMYHIPIIAEPYQDGFVIALTYGQKVDWFANVLAKGGCRLRWKNQDFELVNPELIDMEAGLSAFPKILRPLLKKSGTSDYLKLQIK